MPYIFLSVRYPSVRTVRAQRALFKIEKNDQSNPHPHSLDSLAMAAIVAILKKAKKTRHDSETRQSSDLLEKLPPAFDRQFDVELGMLLTG